MTMKTKAEIVQRLLEDKLINAEEAVILLMSEKEFIPYPSPYPVHPSPPIYPNPFSPIWVVDPHSQPYYTNSFPVISLSN